jgi:hypothetical protein
VRRVVGVLLIGVALAATGLAVWMVIDGGFLVGFSAIVSLLALSAWVGGVVSLRTPAESPSNGEPSQLKFSFGVLFVVLAVAVSAYFLFALVDSLVGGYVGGEVTIVWTLTAVAGVFAAALWAAGLGLTRSRRHHH